MKLNNKSKNILMWFSKNVKTNANNIKKQVKNLKKFNKVVVLTVIIIMFGITSVNAHGGNITGWKDRNSSNIIEHNGKYYGYHNQNGVRHYHEVEWDEQENKWKIVKTAVYYDENFNIISNDDGKETEKVEVKFSSAVDGDTAKFELDGNIITVRFLGIDTPETVHPTKGEQPYGKEASNFTKEKLQNTSKIELEYDNNSSKTDKYNRHLAWIILDGNLLQKELVEKGLAQTYMLQDNYKYAGVLQESEEIAKNQNIGMWSNETTNTLANEISENEIMNTLTDQTVIQGQLEKNSEYIFIIIILILVIIMAVIKKSSYKKRRR